MTPRETKSHQDENFDQDMLKFANGYENSSHTLQCIIIHAGIKVNHVSKYGPIIFT